MGDDELRAWAASLPDMPQAVAVLALLDRAAALDRYAGALTATVRRMAADKAVVRDGDVYYTHRGYALEICKRLGIPPA